MATDIKKILKSENILLGSERVLKGLRNNDIEKVFLAKNAPQAVVDDIKRYASLSKVGVEVLDIPNDELGVICKKPFSVSSIGLKKAVAVKKKH
jgi:large subunit ribosomal protein L30e